MISVEESDLEAMLVAWVQANTKLEASSDIEIGPDTDLIKCAVVDSLGFLDLIEFVEQKTGWSIDLESVDLEDLTTLRGLGRHIRKLEGGA